MSGPPALPSKFDGKNKNDDDLKFLLDALANNHVFNTLDQSDLKTLADAFEPYRADAGETIVEKGEAVGHFYVLQRGKLAFVADGIELGCATVPGNSFGQLALLNDEAHAATCMAVDGEAVLWRIDRETFLKFVPQEARSR